MALKYNLQKIYIFELAIIIGISSVRIDRCWFKGCSQKCNSTGLSANCSCYNGYYLQPDGKTCFPGCIVKGCSHNCNIYASSARCSCDFGYILQPDGKRCLPDPCWFKGCSQKCNRYGSSANCSCLYGYILKPDGKTCLLDPCRDKGCSQKCNTYGSSAICSCHYEYFLLPDGKTCLHGSQLSGASIVLITFGVIFLLFLFAFSFAICHQRKRKLKAVTVRFNTATQSAVVQGLAQNQINNVDIQTGVDNAVISNILLTSNEMGIDNMAHIGTAPPIYEPLAQQLSVSVVFGNDPPPEYSN